MNTQSRPGHDNTAFRSIKPPYPTQHRSPSSANDFQQPISVQPEMPASMQPYSAFSSMPIPAYAPNVTYSGHQPTVPYQLIRAIPENTLFLMPSMTDNVPSKMYIATLLSRLGIPTKLRGFQYIVQALLYLLNCPNESRCLKTEIYAVLASRNQTTPAAVEHAIRHAIGQMWQGDHIQAYCAIMGRSVSPYELCPSTGDFLSSLLLFLRMQMGQECECD